MLKKIRLPEDFIGRTRSNGIPIVEKIVLEDIDEVQNLYVAPWTRIDKHGHDNQWEIWLHFASRKAFVCLKGEEHELLNDYSGFQSLLAIKGHGELTYEEFDEFLGWWGFSAEHGSIIIDEAGFIRSSK